MRNHLYTRSRKGVDDGARTFALGLIDEWLPHPRRHGDVRVDSNPGLRRLPDRGDSTVTYDMLPPGLFCVLQQRSFAAYKGQKLRIVRRSE
jgi:hypothetical protein